MINSINDKETESIEPLEKIIHWIDEWRERWRDGVMREYEQAVEEVRRQAMYTQRHNAVRSCSHSCSGKAESITQAEHVFVRPWVSSMQYASDLLSSVASTAL